MILRRPLYAGCEERRFATIMIDRDRCSLCFKHLKRNTLALQPTDHIFRSMRYYPVGNRSSKGQMCFFPVKPRSRGACVGKPVQGDVVEYGIQRKTAIGMPFYCMRHLFVAVWI